MWPLPGIFVNELKAGTSFAASEASYLSKGGIELLSELLRAISKKKRGQDTAADRIAQVASVTISPRKFVAYVGQTIPFSSLPTDGLGRTVQGVRFAYSSSDTSKLTVNDQGIATCVAPGLAWIAAGAGLATARVPVLILPGARPVQTDAQWDADQARLNANGSVVTSTGGGGMASLVTSLADKLSPTVHAQSGGGDSGDDAFDALWSTPSNLTGHPLNRISESTHIGTVLPESSNFNLAVPIISAPGRVALNLMLYCNSRLWSRNGSNVVFNAVNTWPAPGFSLSFGRIVTYASGSNTAFVLADPDGTLHYLGSGPASQTNTYQATDGSNLTYVGNATTGGTIHDNRGGYRSVSLINNRLLVNLIGDANGNSISITYAPPTQPSCNGTGFTWRTAISSITDTLGRTYQFNTDACNNLVSITGPGLGGTAQNPVTVTFAQFDYTTQSVSTSFSGLTVQNAPSAINVIHHIYFPTPQTGYLLSYSAYGMAYNVSKRVSMSVDGNGNVSDGTEVAHATFNYPTTPSSLTDAPSFTQWTESPGSANPFTYATLPLNTAGPNSLTIRLTPPDAASNPSYPVWYLTRSTDATSPANGLLIQADTTNYSGTDFQSIHTAYANDPGGRPRVQSVITYDETGAGIKTDYAYDQYGNLTQQQDYGYQINGAWQVQRKTVNTYKSDSSYVNAYLRSLLIETDVYDQLNGGAHVAETTYAYDNYAAMGNMENYGGNYSGGSSPPGYNTAYNNQNLTVRGNQTGVTRYSNISSGASETFNNKIDIFGNTVQQQVSCCNLDSYTFSTATFWSSPDATINGDPNGVHLTTLITTDFNTSLKTGETDPNDLSTAFKYDNSGRPTQTVSPTSTTNIAYNDATTSDSTSVSYTSNGNPVSVNGSNGKDGWGRTTQVVDANNGQVNITYDVVDRMLTRTNPFQPGGSPGPSNTFQYDPLGRLTVTTSPDGNSIQSLYSGNTTTLVDQVNRKTQRETDGLGRLVAVTEQDPTGALSWTTNYGYDVLNDVIQVNEGGQIRAFKYDALGRKTYELEPEQSATIDDGTGTMWSRSYAYTSFNKTASITDARKAVTNYGYDSLNRLTSVTYNISNAPGVAATNNLTYTYDNSTTSPTKGLLLSISMSGSLPSYQETLAYDSFDRLSSRTINMNGQSYTVGYQRDGSGAVVQLSYPSGRLVVSTYDSSGRLSSITEPTNVQTGAGGSYLSNVGYNAAGQVTGDLLSTWVTEAYTYDPQRMQLTSHTATASGGQSGGLMSLNYSRQAAAGQMGANTTPGNACLIIAINGNSSINGLPESAAYSYDLQSRLVTSSRTTGGATAQRRFSYDRWGNRTGTWDATSGGNQLQSVALQLAGGVPTDQIQSVTSGATLNYSYDADGNLTSDGTHTYQYDVENRLTSVDGGTTASYSYDYQNQRVRKVVGTAATHYIWDNGQVLAEQNANTGSQLVDYVYWGWKLIAEGAGSQLGANGAFTFFLRDHLSIRLSLARFGGATGEQGHLPFGEPLGGSGVQDKHNFTSYESDAETGTDYAINRQYGSSIGRFLQVDSAGCSPEDPQTLNRYTYVANDPVNTSDTDGMTASRVTGVRRLRLVPVSDDQGTVQPLKTDFMVQKQKGPPPPRKVPPPEEKDEIQIIGFNNTESVVPLQVFGFSNVLGHSDFFPEAYNGKIVNVAPNSSGILFNGTETRFAPSNGGSIQWTHCCTCPLCLDTQVCAFQFYIAGEVIRFRWGVNFVEI